MKPPQGFTKDLSPEAQSRRARENKGLTPWRCGPICASRKAHAKFQADHVQVDRRVSGLAVFRRSNGKGE
jgi:hypothetical protein